MWTVGIAGISKRGALTDALPILERGFRGRAAVLCSRVLTCDRPPPMPPPLMSARAPHTARLSSHCPHGAPTPARLPCRLTGLRVDMHLFEAPAFASLTQPLVLYLS